MQTGNEPSAEKMTVIEHLEEFRLRVLWGLAFLFCGVILCVILTPYLYEILFYPLSGLKADVELSTFSPPESFVVYLKVVGLGGFILTFPLIFLEALLFVFPALGSRHRKTLVLLVGVGGLLFLAGVLFSYFVVLPLSLEYLSSLNLYWGLTPQWRLEYYLNFVFTLTLVFGLAFELPLIVTGLTALELTSVEFLRHYRPHVIVFLFLVSALLTPPDVLTQCLLALPLWLLFELSLVVADFFA